MENNTSSFKSITFFYPSKIVGGAELLFIRLAKFFSKTHKIYYIDYLDGFARNEINDSFLDRISFIEFSGNSKLLLPEGTILMTPLSSIVDVITFIDSKSNSRVFFWSIHPHGLKNVIEVFRKSSILNFFIHKKESFGYGLDFFIQKKALFFMDGSNFFIQKDYFGFSKSDAAFLPIPCEEYSFRSSFKTHEIGSVVNIAWLGRLSEDKISSLVNILQHTNKFVIENNRQINFHIIGDGNQRNILDRLCFDNRLVIKILTDLRGNKLNEYLVENVELLFAMGTSALEGASLRIPTILADFSYDDIPTSNKFQWLYESKNYSLADEYNDDKFNNNTFIEIIEKISSDESNYYGDLCYNYFIENHSLGNVANQLSRLLFSSELQIAELGKTAFGCFNKIGFIRRSRNYIKSL